MGLRVHHSQLDGLFNPTLWTFGQETQTLKHQFGTFLATVVRCHRLFDRDSGYLGCLTRNPYSRAYPWQATPWGLDEK